MAKQLSEVIVGIMHKAADGCKYSELSKGEQKIADKLANRNRITMTPINGGDWIINKA